MAEPQPLSGGLTDQAALGCCSDPDPSTKVGTEPTSPELGPQRGAFVVPGGSRSLGSARAGFEPGFTASPAPPALGGLEWAGKRVNVV